MEAWLACVSEIHPQLTMCSRERESHDTHCLSQSSISRESLGVTPFGQHLVKTYPNSKNVSNLHVLALIVDNAKLQLGQV